MNVEQIEITLLQDHPDNPRLELRQDVIDAIAAQLAETDFFEPAHALLVRPWNGSYQVVRGHHRKAAAEKYGLTEVPCWVKEMTDDEAYLQLGFGNAQGELNGLEIGIHAFGLPEFAGGKPGKKGGISFYAEGVGKDRGTVSKYKSGAKVYLTVKDEVERVWPRPHPWGEKARHLAEISQLDSSLWPQVVIKMFEEEWTRLQVKAHVKQLKKFNIPQEWQDVFLALPDVVQAYFIDATPDSAMVIQLVNKAESIKTLIEIDKNIPAKKFPYTVARFYDWLKAGIGGYAWDPAELEKYFQEIIKLVNELTAPPEPEPQPGEWWELGDHRIYCGDTSQPEFYERIKDATLAFGDPPYNAGNAEWDNDFNWQHDWLTDRAGIVVITPGIASIFDFARITTMPYVWSLAAHITNGMTRGAVGFGNWIYAAAFSTGSVFKQDQDFTSFSISNTKEDDGEKRKKPVAYMEWIIEKFSKRGDTVVDPFLGTGSTFFAANDLGRNFIGGEINLEDCKHIISKWQEQTGQIAQKETKIENTL